MESYRNNFFLYFLEAINLALRQKIVRDLYLCIYFSQKTTQLILENLPWNDWWWTAARPFTELHF